MITPKELDALLKVARKHNVAKLAIGVRHENSVEFTLLPNEDHSSPLSPPAPSSETAPPADMTEEELLFYSSGSPL